MNYITIFVFFSFYKFISWNIFFILFSIFILSKRISIFINKFSNYRWTRSSFLLVDMFCITLIISFGSYKFISINFFIRFCTIFLRSYSLTIFIDVFCNYIWNLIWCEFPCSCEFYIFIFYSFVIFVIFYKFPSTIFYFYFFCFWLGWCYFVAFYFASLIFW